MDEAKDLSFVFASYFLSKTITLMSLNLHQQQQVLDGLTALISKLVM